MAPTYWKDWRHWLFVALVGVDVVAAIAACLADWAVRGGGGQISVLDVSFTYRVLALLTIPVWATVQALSGGYQVDYTNEGLRNYRSPVVGGVRLVAAIAIVSYVTRAPLSRLFLLDLFPTLVVASVVGRFGLRRILDGVRRRGGAQVRLLVVGDEPSIKRFVSHLRRHRSLGYHVVGACVPPGESDVLVLRDRVVPVIGEPDDAVGAALGAGAEAVAVVNPQHFAEMSVQRLAWALERSGIDLLVAPDVVDVAGPRIRVMPITGMPLLHIKEPAVDSLARRAVWRLSQALAVPLLLVLFPVMLLIAILVKLDDGGPVFYRQERMGYRRRSFQMLKFRSMVADADDRLAQIIQLNEHDGALFKLRNDPRVTRVGRIIRRYSLDELPQLLNVTRGDMVFVGPRPVLRREMGDFGELETRRFNTKPGMTGLWQVAGRSTVPWDDAVRLDLYYVENWTPLLDLLILFRTIRVVLGGSGM